MGFPARGAGFPSMYECDPGELETVPVQPADVPAGGQGFPVEHPAVADNCPCAAGAGKCDSGELGCFVGDKGYDGDHYGLNLYKIHEIVGHARIGIERIGVVEII
jgi:hypothetical protein